MSSLFTVLLFAFSVHPCGFISVILCNSKIWYICWSMKFSLIYYYCQCCTAMVWYTICQSTQWLKRTRLVWQIQCLEVLCLVLQIENKKKVDKIFEREKWMKTKQLDGNVTPKRQDNSKLDFQCWEFLAILLLYQHVIIDFE